MASRGKNGFVTRRYVCLKQISTSKEWRIRLYLGTSFLWLGCASANRPSTVRSRFTVLHDWATRGIMTGKFIPDPTTRRPRLTSDLSDVTGHRYIDFGQTKSTAGPVAKIGATLANDK